MGKVSREDSSLYPQTQGYLTRKADRYAQLATNARAKGYKCNVYPIQVGSRGYVDMDSFEPLRKFLKVKTKQYLLYHF